MCCIEYTREREGLFLNTRYLLARFFVPWYILPRTPHRVFWRYRVSPKVWVHVVFFTTKKFQHRFHGASEPFYLSKTEQIMLIIMKSFVTSTIWFYNPPRRLKSENFVEILSENWWKCMKFGRKPKFIVDILFENWAIYVSICRKAPIPPPLRSCPEL